MTTAYPDSYLQGYFYEAHNGHPAIFHSFWPRRSNRESCIRWKEKNTGFRIRPSGNKIPTGTITSWVIFVSYLQYMNFSSSYMKW